MSEAAADRAAGGAQAKESPEGLVLRGKPAPAIRFRRGLIVGLTGAVTASLIAVAWLALEPPSLRKAAGALTSEDPASRSQDDALAKLPSSYGQVPRLGPPLPGDLGRPILGHERSLGDQIPPTESPSADAAEAERQHALAERVAARSSAVMVQLRAAQATAPAAEHAAGLQQPEAASERVDGAVSGVPASQQRKLDFVRSADGDLNPHGLEASPSPWTLSAGTIIPASLIIGLDSDLPGMVLAQVSENVRDSATGRTILVPQGARLIGKYDSVVAYGQRRALLVWKRILFPDGSSIALDNMPATDAAGYAGLEDKVNSHTWRLLKGIALSTLLGIGTQLSLGGSESDLVRAIRESAQQNAANAGNQITARNLDVQPTIRVRPGWPVRAVVNKDLVLQPWRG